MNTLDASEAESAPLSKEIDRVTQTVNRELAGRIRGFSLRFRDQALILEGRARSYYAKQLAQHAVMRVTQLPIDRNDIEVC
jgi:hypothetical protein